jgi:hypothetical protein
MHQSTEEEESDDHKEVIRIRKPKKNKQHNGQKKKYNRTNSDLQNIHLKLKKWEISGLYLSIALLYTFVLTTEFRRITLLNVSEKRQRYNLQITVLQCFVIIIQDHNRRV